MLVRSWIVHTERRNRPGFPHSSQAPQFSVVPGHPWEVAWIDSGVVKLFRRPVDFIFFYNERSLFEYYAGVLEPHGHILYPECDFVFDILFLYRTDRTESIPTDDDILRRHSVLKLQGSS